MRDQIGKRIVLNKLSGESDQLQGYKAYECTEQQENWVIVERLSDGAEVVRIDSLKQDGEVLTIDYKIIEPGINDIIVRTLVPLAVLKSLSGRAFRGSVKLLRFRNLQQQTEDVVPFEG